MPSIKQYAKNLMQYKYPTHCFLCKEPLTVVTPNTTAEAMHAAERHDTECTKCIYHKFVNIWISKFKIETYKNDPRSAMNCITLYLSPYIIICYPENSTLKPETRIYQGTYLDDPILKTEFVDWNWKNKEEFEKQMKFLLVYS